MNLLLALGIVAGCVGVAAGTAARSYWVALASLILTVACVAGAAFQASGQ